MLSKSVIVSGQLLILTALTFTEWFWKPVPTPVGMIIILTVLPPSVIIETYTMARDSYLRENRNT